MRYEASACPAARITARTSSTDPPTSAITPSIRRSTSYCWSSWQYEPHGTTS
ncbi:hypothetical protein [Streptomyces subrutilus]|nr:hypothetical protein [Streptomyces subrutilus]